MHRLDPEGLSRNAVNRVDPGSKTPHKAAWNSDSIVVFGVKYARASSLFETRDVNPLSQPCFH
jgi:hypothetical protein